MRYAALVTTHGSGRVTIRVLEVPGAVTFGVTEADAIERARRIVRLLIRQLMADGLPVPTPSATGDVWIDLPAEDAAVIERYSTGRSNARCGVRSLISTLLAARKRELGEPTA
jgi:predicted RNase H-like HicB family nuclease